MSFDFSGLSDAERGAIESAIREGASLSGRFDRSRTFSFIIGNRKALREAGILELSWVDAYVHASSFQSWGFEAVKATFDECNPDELKRIRPLLSLDTRHDTRLSIFRGCAGPDHTPGMSWTTSLDKAIWYAAWHRCHRGLDNLAVYAATVDRRDVYCELTGYDPEIITCPDKLWRVDVPEQEFRIERPRFNRC